MVQVSWLGQMNTSIPVTLGQVCTWAATADPALIRRFSTGASHQPTAADIQRFCEQNGHFRKALVFLYAQGNDLLPPTAVRPRA